MQNQSIDEVKEGTKRDIIELLKLAMNFEDDKWVQEIMSKYNLSEFILSSKFQCIEKKKIEKLLFESCKELIYVYEHF